ncbi:MBG domain-containing protein, partial [Algoriphagus boritolerans]
MESTTIISESSFSGTVTGSDQQTGGLAGTIDNAQVINSFSSASVTGNNLVGGLGGYVLFSTIKDSYSIGNVIVTSDAGGGLIGFIIGGSVVNSYSSGQVSGSGIGQGGLIGKVTTNPTFTNSFWDTETSGQPTSAGGTGKTTVEMKTQSTFTGWDFTDTWNINPAGFRSYPYLRAIVYDEPEAEPEVNPIPGLEAVNIPPIVTDENISIAGGTGTGGIFKIGDTITATWNNTAAGDNNSEEITTVTVDFTHFGGGAAVVATNNSGTWTAAYTLIAGDIDSGNRNVSVTATYSSNQATTTADTSNATVDNIAPAVSGFTPVNSATGVALQPTLTITFDDEVILGNTGIFSLGKVDGDGCTITAIFEFDLSDPDERSLFTLSVDKLTVTLILTDNLPVNTQVILAIPTGFVLDVEGNEFAGFSAYTYTWSFTTKDKNEQTITFGEIETKKYGDPTFTLANAETDQGLTVTYTATDPTVVSITGNQATILKVGSTTIIATQDGDEVNFAAEPVERTLTVGKKALTITATDQTKVYGEANPTLTFNYSGLTNGDTKVTTEPSISTIATLNSGVGVYPITLEGGSD